MQHLAIIPDGNRRWAKEHKLAALLGHQRGVENFKMTLQFCLKKHIPYVSFYTFSLENFRRSESERNNLFGMLHQVLLKELPDLIAKNIRVKLIGDRTLFPATFKTDFERIEQETASCNALTVNLLFCYGATSEITNATKQIAQLVKEGKLDVSEINEETVSKALWTGQTPAPDIILRTSGIKRLSNFLLFQAAYSEFMFLDEYWPAITESHLEQCFENFQTIKRNFGT
jgi:undecaprenyl diphosphate synthase